MGVYPEYSEREPVREERGPLVLLENGGLDLRAVPGHRGEQSRDREDHQYLPEVRLPEELKQGGNSLPQPSSQHLQLHDRNRLDLKKSTPHL